MTRAVSLTLAVLMALSAEASTRVVGPRETSHRTVTTKPDRAPCVYCSDRAIEIEAFHAPRRQRMPRPTQPSGAIWAHLSRSRGSVNADVKERPRPT
jgi:hypothetical protein